MIKYIKIEGKEYPFVMSFSAIALFMDMKGLAADQVATVLTQLKLSEVPLLLWCGMKKAHEKLSQEFTFSVMDVENWIDNEPSLVSEAMAVFNSMQAPPSKKKANPRR